MNLSPSLARFKHRSRIIIRPRAGTRTRLETEVTRFTRPPPKTTRVAAPLPGASLGRRTVCGRTGQRRPKGSKRCENEVRMVWGNVLTAAAALKTPTRNCYNAQGVNLKLLQIDGGLL